MPLIVSFGKPAYIGSIGTIGLGRVRISETVALDGVSAAAASDGEIAIITNTEASAIGIAMGTTPDAAALNATAATSARTAIGSGQTFVVSVEAGDKISAKALA
jgi:hypothetical protein